MNSSSNIFIILGSTLLLLGVLMHLGVRFGRLPGDFKIEKTRIKIIIPITTVIVIGLVFLLMAYFLYEV